MNIAPPLYHQGLSSKHIMVQVTLALLPFLACKTYFYGTRLLLLCVIALITAAVVEMLFSFLRKRALLSSIADGTGALTALLLTLSLPVNLPIGLLIAGVCVALIFGKLLYGGLGMNIFNPAMLGFVFLLLSFPAKMSLYPLGSVAFHEVDTITGATLLDSARQARIVAHTFTPILAQKLLLCQLSALVGGVYLACRRLLDYRLALGTLLGMLITSSMFYWIAPQSYLSPLIQLFAGSGLFGICFIATDPVTAPASSKGRWIFALLVGSVCIATRNLGNYPDGFALAILLGNALTPLIDTFTIARYR